MTSRPDIGAVAALLDQRIGDVVLVLGLEGRREGHEFVALNPTRADRHLGSFRIVLSGAKRGMWKEFSGDGGGDALDLVCYCRGIGKGEALHWAVSWLGLDGGDPVALRQTRQAQQQASRQEAAAVRQAEQRRRLAHAMWLAAQPLRPGDPVDGYLQGRGIELRQLGRAPGALRFHPVAAIARALGGGGGPAMLAAIQDGAGRFLAVHRTWLEEQAGGWRKRTIAPNGEPLGGGGKLTLGAYGGGFIRIWRGASRRPLRNAPAGDRLAITEGIEDALTIALACPELRVVASVSVGNMVNLTWPPQVGELVVCADNDGAGSDAARALARAIARWQQEHRVSIARAPGDYKDFNDLLRGKAA